ncbi:MAG: AsmA-like C-terminal domain-containing protein [Nitrospirota bacterium]|nr:MAG: AsmA-like C-terminal domain-containing protein [Nitrospirota bacterium]
MKGIQKKLIWGLFFALLVISITLIIIPFLIKPDYLKQLALDQIQQTFGPHISIGRTSLALFPHPRIEVTELVVKERPDAHAFFRTKFVKLVLKIGPLLKQELVVKELRIDQPEIEVNRDQTGRWHLFNTPWAQSETELLGSLLMIEKVSITNGEVTIIDESPTEGVRGLMLDNVFLTVLSQQGGEPLADLQISGRINRPERGSTFNIGGRLEPKSLEVGSPSLASQPRPHRWQFAGNIDVSNLDVGEIANLFHLDFKPSQLLATTSLRSNLRIIAGQTGYDLILSDFSAQNSLALFVGNANIAGLTADDPTISVTFSASPISLETVYKTIPRQWLLSEFSQVLDESRFGGMVEVIQATVTGSTRLDVGLSAVGTFRLENGFLKRKQKWPDIENIRGTIVVQPDRIKFSDFTGVYDSLPVRAANGRLLFKETGPWMEVEVQGVVPGQRVLKVLHEISSVDQTFHRLSTWRVEGGTGLLTLRFAGLIQDVHGLSFEQGEYVAKNLQIAIPEFENPVSRGRGRFKFSPTEIALKNVQGWIGDYPFTMNGNVQTHKKARFERFTLQVTMEGRRFLDSWLSNTQTRGLVMEGLLPLNVVLSGPVETPRVKGNINMVDSRLQIPYVVKKADGVPGSLEFEGTVRSNREIEFDRLEFQVENFRLAGKGTIGLKPVLTIQGKFNTDPVYLGLLPEGVTVGNGVLRSGILEIAFDVQGKDTDWQRWRTNGWVALTEGVMEVKGLETPMTNIFLRLKFDSNEAALQRVEFRMLDSDARLRGSVNNWKTKPDINVILESTKFDIDLVIPKEGRTPLRDFLEYLADQGTLKGTVTIDGPRYKDVPLKNLTALLRIHDNLVILDKIRAESDGGPLAGRVLVHLPPSKPAAVRGSFHIKGLPFEQVHQSVGSEDRLVTGSLSLRGKIQGHGRNVQGVVPTLNGELDVMIENGRVRRGTVLPKILKILNLPALLQDEVDFDRDGFPFDKVTSTLIINDGIANSEDVVVDSPIMKLTGAGTYNLKRDHLDAVTAVSPFGRYSDAMKQIPLFGKIIAGERKGLATALFSVTGSIQGPHVLYMPVSSLTTGLGGFAQLALDILKNTFALPVELLGGDSENSSSPNESGESQGTISVESEQVIPP